MSYHRSRKTRSPLGGAITLPTRGKRNQRIGTLGAIAVVGGGGAPRCPNCGSCGYDGRRAAGTVELLHCPRCGKWSAAGMWGPCEQIVDVVDTYPGYAYPWGWGRPGGGGHGGHHGGHGGGHHPHHGLGDVGDPQVEITPPTVASGSAAEQTALLRRVANAQEAFNRQDLMMRKWQIASVVAIPVAAQVWTWLWALIKRRRGAST
jgi:hypothetical protein